MSLMGGGSKVSGAKSPREIRGGQQAEALVDTIHRQEENIRKLSEIVQALWGLMKARLSMTDEELNGLVQSVHSQNATAVAANCTQCGRPLEKRQSHCLYCGKEDTSRDVFSTLF